MASKLESKFLDSYNAYLLSLVSDRARPGMLLDTDWPFLGIGTPEFEREEGWAWDFADVSPDDFKMQEADVNLVGHKISGKHKFSGEATIPQYGITAGADFNREFSTVLTLTGVRAQTFQSGKAKYELREALRALPDSERKWVDDDLLISTAYYVKSFVAEFHSSGGASAKAKFEQAGQKVDGNLSIEWQNEHTFVAQLKANVPLFVRGIKI